MQKDTIIGIDLGGTRIRGTRVRNKKPEVVLEVDVQAEETEEVVLGQLFTLVDRLMDSSVHSIGIGVPSVVDETAGIVYDVQNIASWKEVHLKRHMELRYNIPAHVNNDANCFALGERYFGQGQAFSSFIGLTIGTGMGAGIVIDGKLYNGSNCGAGEFGMVEYLDQYYEYYASGQFFKHCHHTTGKDIFQSARQEDRNAIMILEEFGMHLGKAIKMILYCYDTTCIILGGSVSRSYAWFEQSMWNQVNTFGYPKSLKKIRVLVSNLDHCGALGAAALCLDDQMLLTD